MKKIICDEHGVPIDVLAVRNEEIKSRLFPYLQEFIEEKEMMIGMKKPPKLGYRFTKQIYLVLASYGTMSAEKFVELDYEEIYDFWLKYLDLTAYYNRYFEIVDNKQLFLSFLGINSRQYAELERSEDEDIRNLMNTINGAFIGLGFVAGESGDADAKAISSRLRAKEHGHEIISAVEDKALEKVTAPTALELEKQLSAIMGGGKKVLLKSGN